MNEKFTDKNQRLYRGYKTVLAHSGEAEGAIPNGARVRKVREDALGEGTLPIGATGTVSSSVPVSDEILAKLGMPRYPNDNYGYFIVWDVLAQADPVFTMAYKIEAVEDP